MRFRVPGELAQGTEKLARRDAAHPGGAAIVEIAGETDAEKQRAPDTLGELAAELASARNDRDSLHALRRQQSRQNDRRHEVHGEQCNGSDEQPGENDALIEAAERLSGPAQQKQQSDGHRPACQNVAGQAPDAGALRGAAGKGQRKYEECEDQVGAFENLAKCEDREPQHADRHNGIERYPDQRRGSGLAG